MSLPDKEAINSQVKHLAEEARDTSAFNASPVRLAPIYMGRDSDVIPDSYVLHFAITTCANCKAESRDNEFYSLTYLRSRVNGTRVRHLTRCDRPLYNLPVARIPTGTHRVPFCCECPEIDLSHLPPPPQASQVYDLSEPTLKGQKPKTKAEKAEPKKASLDDLI